MTVDIEIKKGTKLSDCDFGKDDVLRAGETEVPASILSKDLLKAKASAVFEAYGLFKAVGVESPTTKAVEDAIKWKEKLSEEEWKLVFFPNYERFGGLGVYKALAKELGKGSFEEAVESTKEELSKIFMEKYRRVPMVVNEMAATIELLGVQPLDFAERFKIENFSEALKQFAPGEAVLLVLSVDPEKSPESFSNPRMRLALKCYEKAFRNGCEKFKEAGDWISDHLDSKKKLLKMVSKNADRIDFGNPKVEAIKSQLGREVSVGVVAEIEKAYKKPGFKFSECVFDLKFSEAEYGNYRAEILQPGDTRMVYLGEMTNCCQKLGDAGESAMMHGLVNPRAGFWALTEISTGRVVAQAEVWEVSEAEDPHRSSLVFDNIEFANDAPIEHYREAIGAWLESSPYANVYMGAGYNDMPDIFLFRSTPQPIRPTITAEEAYVLSYEEDAEARDEVLRLPSVKKAQELLESGEITYYDYVYCDSERETLVMKEHGVLEEYFTMSEAELEHKREEFLAAREDENSERDEDDEYEDDEYEDDF